MLKRKEYDRQYYIKNREKALESMRQWYIKNKEKRKEYLKQWRKRNPKQEKIRGERAQKKRRGFIDEYKLSKSCQICGYNKSARALEFHHNGDKEFTIAYYWSTKLKKLKEEMDKCDILCANCHRELHEKETKVDLNQYTYNYTKCINRYKC